MRTLVNILVCTSHLVLDL